MGGTANRPDMVATLTAKRNEMRKVTRYIASDNSEFNCEADAKRHDSELTTINHLKLILSDSLQTMRIDAIVKQITLEHEKISAVLRLHQKRLPRGNKPQTV